MKGVCYQKFAWIFRNKKEKKYYCNESYLDLLVLIWVAHAFGTK